jgi:hypothetical protein
MSALLFVSQATLDAWADAGKVDLDGDAMTLPAGGGPLRYALVPAVHFLHVVGADADPHGLVARVKSDAKLRALGGEWLGHSVVLGDVAYEVEPGFLAELGEAPGDTAAAGAPGQGADERAEAHALARFLLENLS